MCQYHIFNLGLWALNIIMANLSGFSESFWRQIILRTAGFLVTLFTKSIFCGTN